MKRKTALLATLIACITVSAAVVPALGAAAKPAPKSKPAAKKTPQPSKETIKWGKAQCDIADKALKDEQYEKARDIYTQVLWKLPASPRAKEGLKKAEAAIVARQEREKKAALEAAKKGQEYAKERLEIDKQAEAEANQVSITTLAQNFITSVSTGNFTSATAIFNSVMREKMTPAQLKQTWDALLAQHGAFQSQSGIRETKEDEFDCLYVTCVFERASLNVKLVFDKAKMISDIWILPAQ